MATPLAGLTGLYGPTDNQPHGGTVRDPSEFGVPVDARHASTDRYTDEHAYAFGVYGQQVDAQPWEFSTSDSGYVWDKTPVSHAAPFPRGAEQDLSLVGEQSAQLHGLELGASTRRASAPTPNPFHITAGRYDSPNETVLAPTPGQLHNGKDTVQGSGLPNGFGMDHGRQFRRTQTDRMPFDITGVAGGGDRPFYGKHPVWNNRYDVDSWYGAQGDTSEGMSLGETPTGYPTPYVQPPDPTISPQVGYTLEAPMVGDEWVQYE
ncbi:MAG: hypothetical protein ACRDNK_04240 [Solirubrobacteraceae bacterium]